MFVYINTAVQSQMVVTAYVSSTGKQLVPFGFSELNIRTFLLPSYSLLTPVSAVSPDRIKLIRDWVPELRFTPVFTVN